jgi:hypothetical protein
MVMDAAAADKVEVLKGGKDGPSRGHAKVDLTLSTPCLGPVGLET